MPRATFHTYRHAKDDLGHALCDNIRAGDWLMEYTTSRLKGLAGVSDDLATALDACFAAIKKLQRGVIPSRLASVLSWVHRMAVEKTLASVPPFVKEHPLSRQLAVASLQFYGAPRPAPARPSPLPFTPKSSAIVHLQSESSV